MPIEAIKRIRSLLGLTEPLEGEALEFFKGRFDGKPFGDDLERIERSLKERPREIPAKSDNMAGNKSI